MKMNSLSFLLWLVLPLMALHYLLLITRTRKLLPLPPGPVPFPIVGNIFNLRGKLLIKRLTELAHIYGPLISLQLGHLTVMVVSSVSIANEVLHKNDTFVCTRPVGDAVLAHRHHESSLICMPIGNCWRSLRKIVNTQIFSNTTLDATQHLRQRKVEELLSYVHKCYKDKVAVDIGQAAFTTTLNFLSNAFFSVDLADYNSDTCRYIKQLIWEISVEVSKPNLPDFFPVPGILDPQGVRGRMESLSAQLMAIIDNVVQQRLLRSTGANHDQFGRHRDMLDALLQGNTTHSNILHIFMDLFVAGTESTSGMVEWTLAELLRHPNKLIRAKAELKQVIGKESSSQEINTSKLPYLDAIIKEVFRLHPVVPLIPRQVDSEIEICGYRVPKESRIWINMYAMGRDPRVWENPDSFEPERFLGTDNVEGNGRDFELIHFGGGRRICPAVPMAMRMLPLIIGSLVHSFDWELEDGADPLCLDMDDRLGVSLLKAQPLRVIPIRGI